MKILNELLIGFVEGIGFAIGFALTLIVVGHFIMLNGAISRWKLNTVGEQII